MLGILRTGIIRRSGPGAQQKYRSRRRRVVSSSGRGGVWSDLQQSAPVYGTNYAFVQRVKRAGVDRGGHGSDQPIFAAAALLCLR